MRRVVINGKFLTQRITGVQRYAREIIMQMDGLICAGQMEIAVPPDAQTIPEYKNIKAVKVGRLKGQMWEHFSLPHYARKENALLLNLCNVGPLSKPDIVCIHDVKINARPQDFSRKFLAWYTFLFRNTARRAKAIITVSEFSKSEIIKYYHVEPGRIHVVPNAWQHYKKVGYDEHCLEKYSLEKNGFYFAMSSLEPNKNFKWIADAALKNPEDTFAVAGSINDRVFRDGLGFDVPGNMKLLGYVSDEEAKTLMRECKAFLFPSYYEGFGIPPIEAISAGAKQVVVSDIPVMHELLGDGAVYVSPERYDINLRKCTDTQGGVDASVLDKYSWKESARKMVRILNALSL